MSDAPPLRVLHVAETIIGGVSSYFSEIIPYQAAKLGSDNLRLLVPHEHASELVGVADRLIARYHRSGRNTKSLWAFARALDAELKSFQPTVVHIHSSFAGVVARPMIALMRPRPSVIYCPHGWSFLMDIPSWKRHTYALIERSLYRLTDVVINISRYEDQQAARFGILPDRCVVVRNAISPASTMGIASSPFDERYINLLFVGRFDRQKGLDLLLRAMERLQDTPIRLHVIGSWVHDDRTLQPPDNVNILGWMPRTQLDTYYASADGVVMPSRWEGFGLVAIEAMRNGTSVIASDRGALPELIENGRTGYIFSLDENDLNDLEGVLRGLDKQRLREMGDAARAHFTQYFTAETMNRSLMDIYTGLHDGRARRQPELQFSRGNL
ncbi:MAG: glycosyltransferase family 4 protein [Rhodospirillales bacterium]|nr:glycosyltransferase family 4 protein [Rhodospirillales bacterium]